MKYMKAEEIRQMWLDFFKGKGHDVEEGASLVPSDDKSLLWMNAGVTPLKKYFDGRVKPVNPRICNAQKCIRTNDIENVGKTSRHHTFFEMLGNFSIGDYFRDDVIPWAFELLTSDKWFAFPKEKLFITYYPNDLDTLNKWIEAGMDKSHMIPCEGNFWEIGEGPCGPDTEIFFDRGEKYGDFTPDAIKDEIENDRYIEIWNIVFSQYNSDGSGNRGEYKLLPSKNIDTGSGLERLASIMQDVETNFDTDLFIPIINGVEEISGKSYHGEESFKIIADHIRTIRFALSDGALFSNEGRGYVLRRLLRRAVKHGISLGIKEPFLYKLVDTVDDIMMGFYPNLLKTKDLTKKLIMAEEVKFFNTIEQGLNKFSDIISKSKDVISGADAFLLFDTYGFPVELTEEYASERGFEVDLEGFKLEMDKQKERARLNQNNQNAFKSQNAEFLNFKAESIFNGYTELYAKAKIIKVFEQGFVTDVTPFYAVCGGQVGDTGYVVKDGSKYPIVDTLMMPNKQHLMVVENPLLFNEGDEVELFVDKDRREDITKNHSATHLLFKAIREVVGDHASQQGSEVTRDYLRFDFNNFELIKDDKILEIEKLVNKYIQESHQMITVEVSVDEAKRMGAIAEFGEKYGSKVRVVNLGCTVDVCGGTHVNNTKDIERFMLLPISSIGSGIYRAQGLTSKNIDNEKLYLKGYFSDREKLLSKINNLLSLAKEKGLNISYKDESSYELIGSYQDIINLRLLNKNLQESAKALEKEINQELDKLSQKSYDDYLKFIDGDNAFIALEDFDKGKLRNLSDFLADNINSGSVVLINNVDSKLQVLIKTKNESLDAASILRSVLSKFNGNGGGKKDFAQGSAIGTPSDVLNAFKEVLL